MKNSSSGNSVTARKGPGASSMSALNTEPNSEPSLPDPDIADEGSGLNEHFSRAALEEYAQAWRDFEAVQVDAPVSRDSLPMGWNVAMEMSRQTPRTGQVLATPAVVLKVDERLTNGVRACETCSGRGEVGGFQGGGAPGYVTDKCPDCKGTGKAGMALDVPDQRNRGLLQAAKQALAALDRDAALYEARSCLRPAIEREEAFRAAIGEPDCWAILTPNGSKLVSPEEARGALGAYPLYRAADVALGANPWKEAVLDDYDARDAFVRAMRESANGVTVLDGQTKQLSDADELRRAYDAGWVQCALWAQREDLITDCDSAAYNHDRNVALKREFKNG